MDGIFFKCGYFLGYYYLKSRFLFSFLYLDGYLLFVDVFKVKSIFRGIWGVERI